jgi:ATP-binding cassette subfamily F protein uup
VNEYVGGYSDWEARGGSLSEATAVTPKLVKPAKHVDAVKSAQASAGKTKLSYKDQRELSNLPGKIEKLEIRQTQLVEQLSEPGLYQSDHEKFELITRELKKIQAELEVAFARWDKLEAGQ